jgi:FG-GAP-like repeat
VFNGALVVYLSNGDGTFTSGVSYSLGLGSGEYVAVSSLGDFNGDRKTDIVFSTDADNVPGREIVLLGNGDGSFLTTPVLSSGLLFPSYVAEGDFNGDGKEDLAVSVLDSCTTTCPVYVLLGNGDGAFQSPLAIFHGTGPLSAADLNNDGKMDLVLQADPTDAQVLLGNGDGTFSNSNNYILSLPPLYPGGPPPFSGIATADFNGDGRPDVAVGNAVLLGNGNGTLAGVPINVTPGSGAVAVADFENIGTRDAAIVSGSSVYILHNDGSAILSLMHTYTVPQSGGIVVADFNGDGNLDLAVNSIDPISLNWGYSVLLGNGDGSFQLPIFYPQTVTYSGHTVQITVADFNHDGKPDIAVEGVGNQSLAILLGLGDGTFAPAVYYYDAGASFLLIGDFNKDGKLDIVADSAILFGNGDGTFQAAMFPASLNGFVAQFVADVNNDGKPDLLSGNQVALGNGDGTFTLLPVLTTSISGVADLNGDGRLDLFASTAINCCGQERQTGVQLGNGDGTFGTLIYVPASGEVPPFGLLFADMNGDKRPDIILPWDPSPSGYARINGVGILINTTPSGFELSAGSLSPTTVTAGTSAISTVSVLPTFGFNTAVTLSCAGLPTGATCAFNPPTLPIASGTSTLTITTTTSVAAGTYAVQVTGSAGATVSSSAVSLVIQAAPDFSTTPGTPTSQTVSAGQTATFNLSLAGSGTFSGTVNLSCAITPAVTLGPTCSLSSSSEQISGTTAQSVAVKVGTTAPSSAAMVSPIGLSPGSLPWGWTFLGTIMLVGFSGLASQSRKRAPVLVLPVLMLAVLLWVACGGSSSPHNTQGTPAGTYTATVTATSGSLSHATAFKVTVQ